MQDAKQKTENPIKPEKPENRKCFQFLFLARKLLFSMREKDAKCKKNEKPKKTEK